MIQRKKPREGERKKETKYGEKEKFVDKNVKKRRG
jgi:hypothetical protein